MFQKCVAFFAVGTSNCHWNGQVHETRNGGASPGWMLLSCHHEEHWWWHLRPPLQPCSGGQDWYCPHKLTATVGKKKTTQWSKNKSFVKVYNYKQLILTRFSVDIPLDKTVVNKNYVQRPCIETEGPKGGQERVWGETQAQQEQVVLPEAAALDIFCSTLERLKEKEEMQATVKRKQLKEAIRDSPDYTEEQSRALSQLILFLVKCLLK